MQHVINATDKPIKLENGQMIFPGQHYVKAIESDVENAIEKGVSKIDELMKLTKEELKQKADELGLDVKSTSNKEEIAKAINESADA